MQGSRIGGVGGPGVGGSANEIQIRECRKIGEIVGNQLAISAIFPCPSALGGGVAEHVGHRSGGDTRSCRRVKENPIYQGVNGIYVGHLNSHVAFNGPSGVDAVGKGRELLSTEDGFAGGVDNGDSFGAAIVIPVAQIERDVVGVAVGKIQIESEGTEGVVRRGDA